MHCDMCKTNWAADRCPFHGKDFVKEKPMTLKEALKISDVVLVRGLMSGKLMLLFQNMWVDFEEGAGVGLDLGDRLTNNMLEVVDYLPQESPPAWVKDTQSLVGACDYNHSADVVCGMCHPSLFEAELQSPKYQFVIDYSPQAVASMPCHCVQLFTTTDTSNCSKHGDK